MRYDREGDAHYDILSALQKSIRGSDPDAAVHYLGRLLEAGDLLSPCRRLLVIAAEDIGLAYPMVKGAEGIIVLDRTPFYAEMGGQVADHGTISLDGAVFAVNNVQKDKAGKFLHHGVMETGELKVGDIVTAAIDTDRRKAIGRAHSATHLLDAALQKVLGDHGFGFFRKWRPLG